MSDSERMLDPSRMQEILRARLTRRGFLRGAGTGAVGISLGALLAACAEEGTTDGQGPTAVSPEDVFDGEIETGAVNFANWPLYIDKSKDAEGNRIIPSVLQFKDETGIEVNYTEDIQDNQEFFGKIQPQLAAGQDTGYDIIVITNGPQFSALVRNNWVWPLDTTKRPNFDANAAAWAKDPIYDVGNKYSMAWQSGLVIIAGTSSSLRNVTGKGGTGEGRRWNASLGPLQSTIVRPPPLPWARHSAAVSLPSLSRACSTMKRRICWMSCREVIFRPIS